MFKFDNVSVKYGDKEVWSEGNFFIPSGEVTAIIGSNGAGKTTLVKLLLGLLLPSTGSITIGSKRIGFVPQDYHLLAEDAMRGIDLVELNAYFALRNSHTKKERHEVIASVLTKVGANSYAKQRFSTLSGGQQQRIAIAGALVGNPDVLILDEPLSSLDLKSAREIVSLIGDLNRATNLSVIVVAHDLGILLPILTGAIYLVDGHAHYALLDDADHKDYQDLLEHLKTLKVGGHQIA